MLSLEVLIKVSIFCQHIYEWEHRFHISHVTIPASGPHTVLGTIHSIQQMILCKMSTFLGPFHTALTLYNQTPKFSVSCTTDRVSRVIRKHSWAALPRCETAVVCQPSLLPLLPS